MEWLGQAGLYCLLAIDAARLAQLEIGRQRLRAINWAESPHVRRQPREEHGLALIGLALCQDLGSVPEMCIALLREASMP